MGVPASEVGYTPAMPRRKDHEVHKGHVVALEKKNLEKHWIDYVCPLNRILYCWFVSVHYITINVLLFPLVHNFNTLKTYKIV